MIQGRKAQSLGAFTLVEVVLAVLVISMVFFIVFGIVNNSVYYQSFFAKDNAHIIEALHAVPNGQAHVAYLWSSPDFRISLQENSVTVYSARSVDEGVVEGKNSKTKVFGKSQATIVEPQAQFEPHYYQFALLPGLKRMITIQKNFKSDLSCPASTTPLDGIAVTGSEEGFEDLNEELSRYMYESTRTAAAGMNKQLKDEGETVHIHVEKAFVNSLGVYYTTFDSRTLRLSCLMAREGSISTNTRYGSKTEAPAAVQKEDADIIITIQAVDENAAREMTNRLNAGIAAYWKETK